MRQTFGPEGPGKTPYPDYKLETARALDNVDKLKRELMCVLGTMEGVLNVMREIQGSISHSEEDWAVARLRLLDQRISESKARGYTTLDNLLTEEEAAEELRRLAEGEPL